MATEAPRREHEGRIARFKLAFPDESLSLALVLAGGLLLAFVVRYLLAREIATPWIMADELIYSEMAKSFADVGDFLVRDVPSPLNNVLYPALIAPAWLAGSVQDGYAIARAINVILMTLTVVPVYFWGRRLMAPGYALIAPVLVLLMPAFVYTGMLMTENAFLPAVVTACFVIALTLERPTLLRQLLALVAIGVACAVRPQAVVLLAVYGVALGLKLVFDLRTPGEPRGLRHVARELRRFLPTGLALVLLAAGYIGLNAIRGTGLESGLAAYGGVVKVEYDRAIALEWIEDHFAELGLATALIPVSALIVLFGLSLRGWRSTAAERAFVAVAASAFVLVVVEVGVYASRFAVRIEERNMFAVVPLLFLALSLWLARGLPRPLVLAPVAALVPAALLFSLHLPSLLNIGILSDTFGLIPLLRLSSLIDGGVERVELLMRAAGLVTAAAFVMLPRKLGLVVLPSIVAISLVLASYAVHGAIRDHSDRTLALTSTAEPSWIDARIGSDADTAYVYGATPDYFSEAQVLWQTEFWNRSIGTVFTIGPQDPAFHTEPATFDSVTGRIAPQSDRGRASAGARYVVAPTTLNFAGQVLDRHEWLALYRVDPPLRLATHLGGVHPDSWMGDFAALTQYVTPRRAGRVDVRVSRGGWGGPSPPGRVSLKIGRLGASGGAPAIEKVTASRNWTVRSGTERTFTLPTPKAPYRLEIRVSPTFSPMEYGQADPRQLGAQVQISPASAWTG